MREKSIRNPLNAICQKILLIRTHGNICFYSLVMGLFWKANFVPPAPSKFAFPEFTKVLRVLEELWNLPNCADSDFWNAKEHFSPLTSTCN